MDASASPAPPCIAVVNDDTVFVGLMTELLEQEAGYRVISCLEGNKVYDFIKAEQPDLVLLDLVLNREERGWHALELLKLDPATTDIPVILCSAAISSLQNNAGLLARYGVDFIAKPFNLDDLLDVVHKALHGHQPRPKT